MDVERLRAAIIRVFSEWERMPRPESNFRITPVYDEPHDRYVLQDVDLAGEKYRSRTLVHVEIRSRKIWILTDNTEQGIAAELVAIEVPKEQIVLAFYPPALREMGEFAVT